MGDNPPPPRLIEPEPYWTYKAPPTPRSAPPGVAGDWFSLSPGMRREIWRDYQRRNQTTVSQDRGDEQAAPVVSLGDAKRAHDKQRYADLVMQTFRDAEHADRRKFLDRKAEVQIAARERL